MTNNEIDSNAFINARAYEIKKMEEEISNHSKKSLYFQKLPFHKRRRTRCITRKNKYKRSFCSKESQKIKRKSGNLLTHIWYAKRFSMINIFNTKLPLIRREKSDKFMYKSCKRGFVKDDSYKTIHIFIKDAISGLLLKSSATDILAHISVSKNTVEQTIGNSTYELGIRNASNSHSKEHHTNIKNTSIIDIRQKNEKKSENEHYNDRIALENNETCNNHTDLKRINKEPSLITTKSTVDIKDHNINKILNNLETKSIENNSFNIIFDEEETRTVYNENSKVSFENLNTFELIDCRFQTANEVIDFEIIITKKYLLVISLDDSIIDKLFNNYKSIKRNLMCSELILGERYFRESSVFLGTDKILDYNTLRAAKENSFDNSINPDIMKKLNTDENERNTKNSASDCYDNNEIIEKYIDEYLLNDVDAPKAFKLPFLFFHSKNNFVKGKIFAPRSYTMNIWQFMINKGIIPISINELFRLGLENNKFLYPYDFPGCKLFKEYQTTVFKDIEEKYYRTPKSKRINYEINGIKNPFIIPLDFFKNTLYVFYIVADKKYPRRMAVIYIQDIEIGYVIRGGYCFSTGKPKALCVANQKFMVDDLSFRNINSKQKYKFKK